MEQSLPVRPVIPSQFARLGNRSVVDTTTEFLPCPSLLLRPSCAGTGV